MRGSSFGGQRRRTADTGFSLNKRSDAMRSALGSPRRHPVIPTCWARCGHGWPPALSAPSRSIGWLNPLEYRWQRRLAVPMLVAAASVVARSSIGGGRDDLFAANLARTAAGNPLASPIAPAAVAPNAGVNAKALTEYMGHSSITITFDRYGHLLPGNHEQAAALLDAYLGTSPGG
jgi:integrase